MLFSRYQNAGRSHVIQITKGRFESVAQCTGLVTTVTNQYWSQKKLKGDLILVTIVVVIESRTLYLPIG
jgi:hypothetical protein